MRRILLLLVALTILPALPTGARAYPHNLSTPDVNYWRHHGHVRHHAQARVDLNTASRAQLMRLPGIDRRRADRIIAERPYARVSQLETRRVLSRHEYGRVRTRLTVATRGGNLSQPGWDHRSRRM